jgi:D-psicose/D-tagatose/L-ribulose 3-epimerase
MGARFRFAVCNELFEKVPFAEACSAIREIGYDGIEIAPYTLAESPTSVAAGQRREYRRVIENSGLSFVGLHWLMVSPLGLHVTTPDLGLRKRSWEHVRGLIELCADLGDHGVMVFGSPKQRSTDGGMTPAEASKVFADELSKVVPEAEHRGVRILVEALPSNQSNVINVLAEAVPIVEQINSPAVRTMFDSHNAIDETEPHSMLVKRYVSYIDHVHVNEIDGREPGTGDYDFDSLLRTLEELDYHGYVSLEVFDFTRDPRTIARSALDHLKSKLKRARVQVH